jgi:murein DD-endopeptidase MepM/ murein hydrolase activator NlpD
MQQIPIYARKKQSRLPQLILILLVAVIAGGFALWYFAPRYLGEDRMIRISKIRAWFSDPSGNPAWQINAAERCGDAPMLLPTTGFIGVGWGDGWRPGISHTGYDIFSPDGADNVTPILAAYEGWLTREGDWLSTVIIRHPDFPDFPGAPLGVAGSQIWTYYTHMASADGGRSYVDLAFPPGTREVFVEAGTLLGFQGTWSGDATNPTGLHLHFSIPKSTGSGGYTNETEIRNTYDPAPFLGLTADDSGIIQCREFQE